jgi:hypothetical protein
MWIVAIWRNLHALLKRKADKSDEDDEGEKRDNPIRHGRLHSSGLCWRPLFYQAKPAMSPIGTFETCRRTPKTSACWGRPEVSGAPSKRRY